MADDLLLTTGDVARRLGCSSEFVRKLVRQGKLKAERTEGGLRIFDAAQVEMLAQKRREQSHAMNA